MSDADRYRVSYRLRREADWAPAGSCEWSDEADSRALTLLEKHHVYAVLIERVEE